LCCISPGAKALIVGSCSQSASMSMSVTPLPSSSQLSTTVCVMSRAVPHSSPVYAPCVLFKLLFPCSSPWRPPQLPASFPLGTTTSHSYAARESRVACSPSPASVLNLKCKHNPR
jgi:hypothetical protein